MSNVFIKFPFVNDIIRRERWEYPRRRQVVAIAALSPDRRRVCLGTSQKAIDDGRYNLTPPQGQINKQQSLETAATAILEKEIGRPTDYFAVQYLGSMVRQLPKDHPLSREFDEAHYHWTTVVLPDDTLDLRTPFASIGWHMLDTLTSEHIVPMSEQKRAMCRPVLAELKRLLHTLSSSEKDRLMFA